LLWEGIHLMLNCLLWKKSNCLFLNNQTKSKSITIRYIMFGVDKKVIITAFDGSINSIRMSLDKLIKTETQTLVTDVDSTYRISYFINLELDIFVACIVDFNKILCIEYLPFKSNFVMNSLPLFDNRGLSSIRLLFILIKSSQIWKSFTRPQFLHKQIFLFLILPTWNYCCVSAY
jgi:hypothetical protein